MAEAPEQLTTERAAEASAGPVLGLSGGESYRPLSLLAVAGFSLAVIYALAVTVGGLAVFAGRFPTGFKLLLVLVPAGAVLAAVMRRDTAPARLAVYIGAALAATAGVVALASLVAFSGSHPWLLPDVMWGVVLAAAVVSWMARVRIQKSEDTLSGAALARWGLGLSLFFGAFYAVYNGGTMVAVRVQARQCAEEYLEQLKKGNMAQAFLLTLKPQSRPAAGTDPREILEVQYNTPRSAREGGAFSKFCQSDLVRVVALGGEETTFRLEGVTPVFDAGFRVIMRYQVVTPHGDFEAAVTAYGQDSPEGKGRQWHVEPNGTSIVRAMTATAASRQLEGAAETAMNFARAWTVKVRRGDLDGAYLDTLEENQRKAQREAGAFSAPGLLGAAGLGPLGIASATPARQAFRDGRQAFAEGAILDVKEFWASTKKLDDGTTLQESILGQVRQFIAGKLPVPVDFDVDLVRFPLGALRAQRIPLGISCRMIIAKPTGEANFRVEGELVVETPVTSVPNRTEALRIRSLRLIRGQSAPAPAAQPGRPPGR